jgi:hypothetical protein
MFFRGWFRRLPLRAKAGVPAERPAGDDGIAARVDMVRFEALAEAAYNSLFENGRVGEKRRFGEVRGYFNAAIDAAERARLPHEATRLARRRDQALRAYKSQIRYLGQ